MAVYDLEEQEQLDELKTWWNQYGNLVTGILLVIALAAASWQGWNWWQRSQGAQASAVYASLQQAAMQKDAKRARELAGELIDKYGKTVYAGMGALLAARIQVDAGEAKNARPQLTWAAEHAADPALRDFARLRLATLLLDEQAYDEALKQLAAEPAASLAARFAEVRGDVLAAQGKPADARAAYELALSRIASNKEEGAASRTAYRDAVQAKLDAMGAT